MSVLRLGRRAMGTTFEVVVVGTGDDAARLRAAAEEALALVDRLEEQLSVFLSTSEVSRLNARAAREAVEVEPGLYALLQRALRLHRDTGGAFDVALDPLMEAWGFRGAPPRDPRRARRLSGTDLLDLCDGRVRFRREGVRIDLGGIGKGYALDRAAACLRARGIPCAFLHGGTSTVYALGAPPGEPGWQVGLVDPRDEEHRLGTLWLRDRALSVSGSQGRVVQKDGRAIGHVIDPRTGRPVERPAAWAVSPSATETDALSTAFLVLGAKASRAYVGRHPGTGAIVLDEGAEPTCAGLEPTWERSVRRPRGVSRRALLAGTAAAAAAFSVALPARSARADESPREVKVAVVGLGEQGLLLLGQLARMQGVVVRALCDLRKEALERGLALAGRGVETYRDLDYLLEEEALDALVVATPTHEHAGPATAALAAGLHVFCEAPLAHRLDDARAMARAAARAGTRVFQTGHQRRANPMYVLASEHAEAGALGALRRLRGQWHRRRSWRRIASDPELDKRLNWRLSRATSGGLLLELGSHVFDLGHWLFGALPEAVSGFGALTEWKDGRDVDDVVQVLLRYPGGRQLSFEASLVDSHGDEREWIVGNAATILMLAQHKGLLFKEADAVAIGWEQYARTEMLGAARGIVIDPEATKYKSHEKGEALGPDADKAAVLAELETFVAAVRGGEKPACGAREGLQAAVTGIVAAQAVATGRVIEFTKEHFEV